MGQCPQASSPTNMGSINRSVALQLLDVLYEEPDVAKRRILLDEYGAEIRGELEGIISQAELALLLTESIAPVLPVPLIRPLPHGQDHHHMRVIGVKTKDDGACQFHAAVYLLGLPTIGNPVLAFQNLNPPNGAEYDDGIYIGPDRAGYTPDATRAAEILRREACNWLVNHRHHVIRHDEGHCGLGTPPSVMIEDMAPGGADITTFVDYINYMRQPWSYGDQYTMQAVADLYNARIIWRSGRAHDSWDFKPITHQQIDRTLVMGYASVNLIHFPSPQHFIASRLASDADVWSNPVIQQHALKTGSLLAEASGQDCMVDPLDYAHPTNELPLGADNVLIPPAYGGGGLFSAAPPPESDLTHGLRNPPAYGGGGLFSPTRPSNPPGTLDMQLALEENLKHIRLQYC